MNIEFDTTELDQYTKDLLDLALTKLPGESVKFMKKEQSALRKLVRQKARSKVHKKTGRLFKSVDKSKAYHNSDGDTIGKVYIKEGSEGAPHAHLIEDGHVIVGHAPNKTSSGKRTTAYNIVHEARNAFEPQFTKDCEEWVDEMLREKGL